MKKVAKEGRSMQQNECNKESDEHDGDLASVALTTDGAQGSPAHSCGAIETVCGLLREAGLEAIRFAQRDDESEVQQG